MGIFGILFPVIVIGIFVGQGVLFGFATDRIIENKGYDESWFWWGFFFGFIALLVALSKPENYRTQMVTSSEHPLLRKSTETDTMNNGGWRCYYCNSLNASIVTSCACGKNKEDTEYQLKNINDLKASRAAAKSNTAGESVAARELNTIELIAKYKDLLDSGAITQEEFETKKKSLLQNN